LATVWESDGSWEQAVAVAVGVGGGRERVKVSAADEGEMLSADESFRAVVMTINVAFYSILGTVAT
jgi:hypothetical protein